jgi:hypothetical protein
VGVLPSLSQDYYDGLVKQGKVTESMVHGYLTYLNEYPYDYQNHQLVSKCITVVQGEKACHVMILCERPVLNAFGPTFEYVINSLRFLSTGPSGKADNLIMKE